MLAGGVKATFTEVALADVAVPMVGAPGAVGQVPNAFALAWLLRFHEPEY